MKKITMFFSALLFSMMSFAGVVTFGPADFLNQGTTGTGSYVEATKDGVTVSCDKGYGTSYALRCYKEGVVTISASETISSLTFTFDTYNDRYYNGDLEESYTVGATSWSATLTNQARFTSITVTLGEGGETPDQPEEPETPETPDTPAPEGVITCAEAVAICEATGETATTETYTIRGYVTEIKTAYSEQYGNISFWMADTPDGGKVLQGYRVKPVNDADINVAVGDYVEVVGTLVNYMGNTPEVNQGGTYTIVTPGSGETPETPDVPTPEGVITCAEALAICEATGETSTTESYTIRGYVTEIKTVYSEQYGNISFWMADTPDGGKVLQAYRVKPVNAADINVAVGDFVEVVGTLVNYMGNTPEVNQGGTYTIVTPGSGETPDTDVVNVKDLAYADAYYMEEDGVAYWDIQMYNVDETGEYYEMPIVYLGVEAKSKTALNGEYDLLQALYGTTLDEETYEIDGVWIDETIAATLTIKNVDNEGYYSFVGTFVGEDGKTYNINTIANVWAFDDATDEEIVLSEESTPTTDGAVTFDADVDQGNASETVAAYEVAKNGVTMAVSSGRLGIYNDETHYRIYKNQTLTLTSTVGKIVKVEFTCTANDDAQYGPGCFTVDGGDYTYAGPVGTWTGSASEIVFSASVNQVRATQVVVTLESSGTGVEDVVTVEVPVKVIENGQLMIIRGENVYNVLGAQVK